MATLFPPPPSFYTLYTDENLQLHLERRRLEDDGHILGNAASDRLPALTVDPPPPLEPGTTYTVFGREMSTTPSCPTLNEAGVPQLYSDAPGTDLRTEIKRLVLDAVFEYLNVLRALADDPPHAESRLATLRALLLNTMHIANLFRPHQALETLVLMLELQIYDSQRCLDALNAAVNRADQVLVTLSGGLSKLPESVDQSISGEAMAIDSNVPSPPKQKKSSCPEARGILARAKYYIKNRDAAQEMYKCLYSI